MNSSQKNNILTRGGEGLFLAALRTYRLKVIKTRWY